MAHPPQGRVPVWTPERQMGPHGNPTEKMKLSHSLPLWREWHT